VMKVHRTTHFPNHAPHRIDELLDLGLRQPQSDRIRDDGFVGWLDGLRWVCRRWGRRRAAHDAQGCKPIEISKASSTVLPFFLTLALAAVLPPRAAFAHDAPAISPTRLEFDASQAPKSCNDQLEFESILANWVPREVMSSEADRRLVVRIRRSPMGVKSVGVMLLDAAGKTLDEHRERFDARLECYRVLYKTALASANLLGAFKKPPPAEPCPACPVCPSCRPPPREERARFLASTPPPPRMIMPLQSPTLPPMRRAFLGAGVFLGMGVRLAQAFGPQISLGFVPLARVPHLHIEIEGAWAPNALSKSSVLPRDMIPLFSSLCYAPSALRLCSGLVTTFFLAEGPHSTPENDALHMTLAASLRLGMEFEVAGPFSIRLDGFTLMRFWGRSYGSELAAVDHLNPFAAGMAAMGVWSFE
jgi:hypothetical protein